MLTGNFLSILETLVRNHVEFWKSWKPGLAIFRNGDCVPMLRISHRLGINSSCRATGRSIYTE